jgi:hypothetical protein
MRKKVKSFALEDGPYEQLYEMFKDNYVEIGPSYCINRYIKEFLVYLTSIKKALEGGRAYTVPMSFIIETAAREPTFKIFDSESSIKAEADDLQNKFDVYIKKNPEKVKELDTDNIRAELEYTKIAKMLIKIKWEEMKRGRDLTDEENREEIRKIGGNELVKGLRTKVRPIALKLEKYDPDVRDLWEKISNRLIKKQTKEGE